MPLTVPYAASNVYQPNGRLVDLIRLHGEQTADAQRRAGEIQAQMWGNLASTIQAGANSVLKAKQDAPIAALNALKVNEATHEAKGKTALADTMRMQPVNGPMQPGEQRPPPSNPYLKQEGDVSVWDVEGLSKAMASQGFGDLTSSVVKDIGSLNDAHRAEAKARRDFGDAQQNVLARGAGTILSILKDHPDADPSVVTNLVGQQMAANSTFPPAQIQQTIQQLLSDPSTLRTKLETLSRLGTVAPIKLGKDDVLLSGANPTGAPIASNLVTEPGKGDYTINGQRFNAKGEPIGAVVPSQTAPKSYEKSSVLLDGKPAEILTDPAPNGKIYDLNRNVIENAAARIKPIPPAALQAQGAVAAAVSNLPAWALDSSRPVGPDGNVMHPTLHMTPNGLFQDAQTVIATGQYPQMSRGNDPASQAKRAAIDSKIGAIAADAGMDVPTLRAFYRSNAASLGQQQKAYDIASVAIAKADRDVDLLEKILPKVGDTGSPLFNKPLRAFEQNVRGDENLSEMATRLRSVQNEYTRILNASPTGGGGGVMSDSARHETDQLLAPNATVGQMLRSIAALKSEGGNRLLSQGEQIQRIQARMMGKTDPTPAAPTVPANVAAALKGQKAGVHTLSDGSKWMIAADGAISKQ